MLRLGVAIVMAILLVVTIILIKRIIMKNGVPKVLWKPWYNYIAKYNLETMNYGYASLSRTIHNTQDFSLNLYDKVAMFDSLDLKWNAVIVEIGCGRGGGLYHLAKQYPQYTFIGLDYSTEAIESAKATFQASNLSFIVGDASNLSFPTDAIDVVLNVESSHCYPDFNKFIQEVHRVLQPHGHFCYTDFRNSYYDIQESFNIVLMEDITQNVLHSLQLMMPTRQQQVQECKASGNFLDKLLLSLFANEFVGGLNSGIYNSLKNGEDAYILLHAINNKVHTPVHKPLFTTANIRTIFSKQMPLDEFKQKVYEINQRYSQMPVTSPQTVITTNQPYSRTLLKTLSKNFTKPVLFTNHGLSVDQFKLYNRVQIKEGEHITHTTTPRPNMNVFNQLVDSKYFASLNKVIKETIHYDYFDTVPGHVTGIHNEMNSTINIHLEGEKQWLLVDPQYSDYMIPLTPKSSQLQYVSMVYGWNQVPKQFKVPHYSVTLKKGDMLFVPSWWWHQPVALTRSKHIALRTVHDDTFYHDLFMPSTIYKFAYMLPYIYNDTIPTDNKDLNACSKLVDYYKSKGIVLPYG